MPNRQKPRVHARDHEHGGADPQRIHYEDVGGGGDGGGDGAAGLVIADEGTPLPSRGTLDFVGDGVEATDDAGSDSIIVMIPGGGGDAALVIADEGTPLPARGTLDFQGAGVTATDDSGSDSTIVMIGGDIRFETYPQTGGWLYIEVNDATAAPGGHGIFLNESDGGILVVSSSPEGMLFDSSSGSFLFHAPSSPSVDFAVYVGGDIWLRPGSGGQVVFGNPLLSPLLKVDTSGGVVTYHIRTGASWVADL